MNVEDKWDVLKQTIVRSCDVVLGMADRHVTSTWYDERCRLASEEKKTAWLEVLQKNNDQNKAIYREACETATKIIRHRKREETNSKLMEIESAYEEGESRAYYQAVKFVANVFKPKRIYCKDNLGRIVTDDDQSLEVWRVYFEKVLNPTEPAPCEPTPIGEPEESGIIVAPPSDEEVWFTIQDLKKNKAPGEDGKRSKVWKCC